MELLYFSLAHCFSLAGFRLFSLAFFFVFGYVYIHVVIRYQRPAIRRWQERSPLLGEVISTPSLSTVPRRVPCRRATLWPSGGAGPGGPGGRAMHPDFLGPGAKERACGGGDPQRQEAAMHAWGTRSGARDSRSGASGLATTSRTRASVLRAL